MEPLRNQPAIRKATSVGRLKKNLSSLPASASACHAASSAAPSRIWPSSRRLRIALDHFSAKLRPDFAVQLMEARLGADIDQVAWARKIHRVAVYDAAGRSGGQHHHFPGQRDGLFQIVGDEQN